MLFTVRKADSRDQWSSVRVTLGGGREEVVVAEERLGGRLTSPEHLEHLGGGHGTTQGQDLTVGMNQNDGVTFT